MRMTINIPAVLVTSHGVTCHLSDGETGEKESQETGRSVSTRSHEAGTGPPGPPSTGPGPGLSSSHQQSDQILLRSAELHPIVLQNWQNLNWEPSQEVNLLTWLSLANNNIKSIENLNQNVHLDPLDLSGNGLTNISDLSFLKNLKTLLLHKNKINSLR